MMRRTGIDFTSALYLGLHHPSWQIGEWQSLTSGKPAFLYEPDMALKIARYFARIQGFKMGYLAPSSLHLFWDLFNILAKSKQFFFYRIEGLYPSVEVGISLLPKYGMGLQTIRDGNRTTLLSAIHKNALRGLKPVIITDGWLIPRGVSSDLPFYREVVSRYKGLLVVDDTQAIGLLGQKNQSDTGYGRKGGGSFQWMGIPADKHIISICSLAKSFGVPLAVMAGSNSYGQHFGRNSLTRVHNSPVSLAHLIAARNAIKINESLADSYRQQLYQKVIYFRKKMHKYRISVDGGIFPVQTIANLSETATMNLYKQLHERNIHSLLLIDRLKKKTVLTFILNTTHRKEDIDTLIHNMMIHLNPFPKRKNHIR